MNDKRSTVPRKADTMGISVCPVPTVLVAQW